MADPPLHKLIEERRQRYNATKNTYCPLLKEVVYFNNKGFFHITHDGRDRLRPEADARMRLNLIPHIDKVISHSTKLNRNPVLVPKTETKFNKELSYYELYHYLGRSKSKRKVGIIVVLRRIGNGRLHFYSVRYASNKQNRP
jgi:hypothetical protein